MKYRLILAALVACFAAMTTLTTPSRGQDVTLPLDHNALFKTHVAHLNSGGGQGGGGTSSSSGGGVSSFSGSSYVVGSTVTPTTTGPEAEEHIAVDPSNSNNLISAISDFSLRGGSNTTKYAVSADYGTNWSESYVPLDNSGFPITSDGKVWPYNSDPVVAVDKLGHVYVADLYFHSETGNNANGLYVSVGFPITASTTLPVATNLDPSTNISEDKEWIAVDNSNSIYSGTVYVSWTRFVGNSDYILLSRSTNNGATWTAPIPISPTSQNGAVQGSQVAVGPNGEVYVAYEVFFVGGVRRHYLAKSVNGGATFGPAVSITPNFSELNFSSTYRKNSFPALAVTPSGYVVDVYASQVKSTGADVQFIRSTTPGGTTFTTPVRINDVATGQQFFPAVTADSAGVIHASWFDTRRSTSGARLYDIFATFSTNNGTTWSPNTLVTAALINSGNTSFIGDYAGIAAGGGLAHPVWTSGGFNNGFLQTAALQLP